MDVGIEEKWIKDIREGNEEAFEKLFRAYYSKLHWYIWGYVGSETIAENLVQDLFAGIWEKRQELEPGNMSGYLYCCAKNLAIDYLRHKKIERKYVEDMLSGDPGAIYPEKQIHDRIFIEQVQRAIQDLPERRKMIFILSRYNHLSHKEIGELLGISENTVKTQIMRVLNYFREKFASYLSV